MFEFGLPIQILHIMLRNSCYLSSLQKVWGRTNDYLQVSTTAMLFIHSPYD